MITNALMGALDEVVSERLRQESQRQLIASAVMEGFALLAKKPVPDLENRTEELKKRVLKMAEEIKLSFVNGRLVVKVAGSSEALMKELRYGTDWYAPWDKVDETVYAAALVDPPK